MFVTNRQTDGLTLLDISLLSQNEDYKDNSIFFGICGFSFISVKLGGGVSDMLI